MAPSRHPSRSSRRPSPAEYHRSTVSSRPSGEWYHNRNLTIVEYARKAVADPPPRVKLTSRELERYTKDYVKCILLAQAQNEAMAHDPEELRAAHLRVESRLAKEQHGMNPLGLATYAQIDAALDDYEQKCKRVPETFDECVHFLSLSLQDDRSPSPTFWSRILLATYAMNYLMLMVDHVLNHPTRHHTDNGKVLKMLRSRGLLPFGPLWVLHLSPFGPPSSSPPTSASPPLLCCNATSSTGETTRKTSSASASSAKPPPTHLRRPRIAHSLSGITSRRRGVLVISRFSLRTVARMSSLLDRTSCSSSLTRRNMFVWNPPLGRSSCLLTESNILVHSKALLFKSL
ncbi:hypothetical protein FPV67DRAFT_1480192 [Lyophyllum atratum]|nr:hypothetical protein FPV67DRAFT_1480192 [Lyophyllum atratum]